MNALENYNFAWKENSSFGYSYKAVYPQSVMFDVFQELFLDEAFYLNVTTLFLNQLGLLLLKFTSFFRSDSEQPWEDVNMMHSVCVGGHTEKL